MGLMVRVGPKGKGKSHHRQLINVGISDLYAVSYNALMAIRFLKVQKTMRTGGEMGISLVALKSVLGSKLNHGYNKLDRLPLGTILWSGSKPLNTPFIKSALGEFLQVLNIWGSRLKKNL